MWFGELERKFRRAVMIALIVVVVLIGLVAAVVIVARHQRGLNTTTRDLPVAAPR